jgi:dihydroorotase
MAEKIILGRLTLPDGVRLAGLHIRGEKIAGIVPIDRLPDGVEIIDHRDCYILPGLIEVHGHMREPGLTHKEDYETGTKAALAGGVTTVLDMPNTNPPTTTRQLLNEKAALATGRSYADFAFFFGGARDNADEIAALDPREVTGVKFFMAGHETTPTTVTDVADLYTALKAMQGKNLVALFHAENQTLINRLSATIRAQGRDDGRAYSEGRGPIVARTAIAEALSLTAMLGIPAYICHISTMVELGTIEEAKNRDGIAYAEVVGYHLTFSMDDYDQLGTLIKVSPPVRERTDVESLWQALEIGRSVDTIASEHTPHTRDEKNRPMSQAASGTPGIQENLVMIVTQYRQRYPEKPLDAMIEQVARLGSTNVARIFGLSNQKGSLAPGLDADFVILDTAQTWTLQESDLYSKCGWSAFTGRTATCRVVATYLRGERVYDQENGIIGAARGRRLFR